MNFPIREQAKAFEGTFKYFNMKLFDNKLPQCMTIFSRNQNIIGGYFSPDKWENEDGIKIGEIALNANLMQDGDFLELFNTLVHEMVHLEQYTFGEPGRANYHNEQYADWAERVGLKCVDTKTGKRTGQSMTTTLVPSGPAEDAIANIPEELLFPWYAKTMTVDNGQESEDRPEGGAEAPKKKAGARSKYTCAECGLNVWAKGGVSLICGECNRHMVEEQ